MTTATKLEQGVKVRHNGIICKVMRVNSDGTANIRPEIGNWLKQNVSAKELETLHGDNLYVDLKSTTAAPKPTVPKLVVPPKPGPGAPLSEIEQVEFTACEGVIERGLKTYYEVGSALLSIRDNRLYRAAYGTFEDYCDQRWGMGRNYANKVIAASQVVSNLGTNVPNLPTNEAQARPLATLQPEQQREAWQFAVDSAPNGKPTAAQVEQAVEAIQAGEKRIDPETGEIAVKSSTLKALQSSVSNEWYTPGKYIEAARAVLGAFDLDPASCEFANRTVQAAAYFTKETDGLNQAWHGRIWLNPPYGKEAGESNQALWSAKLIAEYRAGRVTDAVMLVNAVTDRVWFQALWDFPMCFTDHRVVFYNEDETDTDPTHGNVFVYFGDYFEGFYTHFQKFGRVVYPRNTLVSEVLE